MEQGCGAEPDFAVATAAKPQSYPFVQFAQEYIRQFDNSYRYLYNSFSEFRSDEPLVNSRMLQLAR